MAQKHIPSDRRHRSAKWKRKNRGKALGSKARETIRKFVEKNRNYVGDECLFVPAAQPGIPASLNRFGRKISAARYMLLLTQGTPKNEKDMCRHRCGNGHLSCVNPDHLLWGTRGDNVADANRHRKAGDDVQERVAVVSE